MTYEEWISIRTWRESYATVVHWQDGRKTIEKASSSPVDLIGARNVARNSQVIRRIETHDMTGCLETI